METIHGNDEGVISVRYLEPGPELDREPIKDRHYFNKPNRTLVFGVIISLGAHALLLLLQRTTLEPVVTPSITTLSIHLVHAPRVIKKDSTSNLRPTNEPMHEPEQSKKIISDKPKKSMPTIINEPRPIDFSTESLRSIIQNHPALENPSATPNDSNIQRTPYDDVFDPRLREKLLRSHVNARQEAPEAMQITSNVYGTMIEITNGPCFMPKESMTANEGVNWYHVNCNKGDTEEDKIMRSLKNINFVK